MVFWIPSGKSISPILFYGVYQVLYQIKWGELPKNDKIYRGIGERDSSSVSINIPISINITPKIWAPHPTPRAYFRPPSTKWYTDHMIRCRILDPSEVIGSWDPMWSVFRLVMQIRIRDPGPTPRKFMIRIRIRLRVTFILGSGSGSGSAGSSLPRSGSRSEYGSQSENLVN